MTISSAISKALPAAEAARKWRPSLGHVYHVPTTTSQPATRIKDQTSKEATPMPDTCNKPASTSIKSDAISLERAAEEAFMVHMRHGGEYLDENPITGRPGEFHLSSTGRKPVMPSQDKQLSGVPAMNGPQTNAKSDDKKESKSEKSPKPTSMPKPKRKKSKLGGGTRTPTSA